jgi:hypothetical protein
MTTLSLAFSLLLSSVTSTFAVAPAGITAPLEPTTALLTVALKRSPTLLVLVHTFVLDARLSCAPAGIVPTLAAEPPDVLVTVFPLEVTEVVGVRVVVVGVRVVVRVVVVRVVPVLAAAVVGVTVLGVAEAAGTSVSAGCAAESRFAS